MAKTAPTPRPDLSAEDWFRAASERANSLTALYDIREYALAMYVAGLSAECLFRAHRERLGLPARTDHNLSELAAEAKFAASIPKSDRAAYELAMGRLIAGWENKHRFRSGESMRRWLKLRKLDRKIKGDPLKENARRMIGGAVALFNIGAKLWTKP